MQRVRAVVVDDEKPARRRLLELLESAPHVEVVAVCAGGAEAVSAIKEKEPDLVFLDVQMPELDGFAVIKAIGLDAMPVTVFVTAYDRYALRAFDAHAIDYLLKPYSDERFETALKRAERYIQAGRSDTIIGRMQALIEGLDEGAQGRGTSPDKPTQEGRPNYLDRLVLKARGRVTFLKVEEIIWIEAAGVYVKLHTKSEVHLHRALLGELEAQLDPRQFVRIHRSYIVNIEQIEELLPDSHGDFTVVLKSGEQLRLSRNYRPNLQARLGQQL